MKLSKRTIAYAYLLINVVTWGAFLPIVKIGFNNSTITPFRYLFYRFILASVLSIPFFLSGIKRVRWKVQAVTRIVLIEIVGTSLALTFLYLGLHQTTSLQVNLLATILPVFITLGGVLFLREKEEEHEWLGLGISLVGTLVLISASIATDSHEFTYSFFGIAFVLLYNVCTLFYTLLVKKYYAPYPKLFVASVSFFVGAFTFGILSLMEVGLRLPVFLTLAAQDLSSPLILFVIFYAAVFGSIIGLTAFIKGQDGIEVSEAGLFSYLQPLVYIPLGFFLLQERINIWQIGSLLLVILGVYIAERRVKNKRKKIR